MEFIVFGIDLRGVERWEFDVFLDENNTQNRSSDVLYTSASIDHPGILMFE
jgi:hypothetical protein